MRNLSMNELQKHDLQHLKTLHKRKGKRRYPYNALLWLPLVIVLMVILILLLQVK